MDLFALYERRTGAALARLSAEGALPPDLDLDRFTAAPAPAGAAFDLVVDAALVYARAAAARGRGPLDLAQSIAADLVRVPCSASVDVAGPGFVNVTLRRAAVADAVASILRGLAPGGKRRAGGSSDAARPLGEPSLDEVRAAVAAEQVAALSAAAGLPVPHGAPRTAPGRVVVRGRAVDGRRALAGDGPFRFAVASRRIGEVLHLDVAALSERSRDNPAFWVPYAHSRLRGVLRRAAVVLPDIDLAPAALAEADLSCLTDGGEAGLVRLLIGYPQVTASAAATTSTHRFAAYLCDVAAAAHSQWNRSKDQPQLRFVNEEERVLATARLALVTASTLVLKSGLGILGVTAPDEMC